MAVVAHAYKLGKDQSFTFSEANDQTIANKDVKSVTITNETSAEAEVTTRGSDNINEFVPVRKNAVFEVVVLDHHTHMHATGIVTIAPAAGGIGNPVTGVYYVNSIGEPQEIDDVVQMTITLRKYPSASA